MIQRKTKSEIKALSQEELLNYVFELDKSLLLAQLDILNLNKELHAMRSNTISGILLKDYPVENEGT